MAHPDKRSLWYGICTLLVALADAWLAWSHHGVGRLLFRLASVGFAGFSISGLASWRRNAAKSTE